MNVDLQCSISALWVASVKWNRIDCIIQHFRPVLEMPVLRGVRFHGPKPSLLIRDSCLPVKLTPGTGWCVLFGAVYSAHAAGKEKKGNESNFLSILSHQNWTLCSVQISVYAADCISTPSLLLTSNPLTGYSTHCYLIYWPAALVPAIRPPHSWRLCFTSLSPRYHYFSHHSCLPSCGLSNRTLTM